MSKPLSCDRVRHALTDYLERALPEGGRLEFEDHLYSCPDCQRHLQQMRWTIDHLQALPGEPMPDTTKAKLLQALHKRQSA